MPLAGVEDLATLAAVESSRSFPQLARLVNSSGFNRFIIATILVAAVLVGLSTSKAFVAEHGALLDALDALVLWIFALEAAAKILAHWPRPLDYFKDPWNVFDFTIVVVCFLPFDAEYVAVLRLARVLRVLRLLSVVPRLQLLVGALLKSIPSMLYVTILLSILFYIYAVLGVMLFGDNDPKHYGTLGDSLLSLFRVVTLEDWTDVMYTNMYGSDRYGYDGDFGDYPDIQPRAQIALSVAFHVSFVLLGTMIMLNLFIGVIMTGMQEAQEETDQLNREKGGQASKFGDYSAVVAEMKELEEHVEALRNRLKRLRVSQEEKP